MKRIGLWCAAVTLVAAGAMLIGGCLPNDMPGYTNDGKTVVTLGQDTSGSMLWTYDVQSQVVTPHPLANQAKLRYARLLGDDVWVECQLPRQPGDGNTPGAGGAFACKRYDAAKNEFVAVEKGLSEFGQLQNLIPASQEGRKCFFLSSRGQPATNAEKFRYTVYSYPDMEKQKDVELDKVFPAGRFCWIACALKEFGQHTWLIDHVDLFNAEGKQVGSIPSREMGTLEDYRFSLPAYARASDDGSVLLLAFGGLQSMTYGLFDTAAGKQLWGGVVKGPLKGNPVIKRSEIWMLQWAEKGGIRLVRRTPGEKPGEDKAETILTLPARPYADTDQYTPSPDGSEFVLKVSGETGKPSQLLFIPIKEGVTEKDVRSVELKAAP